MVTIGLSTVFQPRAEMDVRRQPAAVPTRVHQPVRSSLLGLQIQTVYVMSLVVSVAMMIGMAWFFRASKYGLRCAPAGLQPAGRANRLAFP